MLIVYTLCPLPLSLSGCKYKHFPENGGKFAHFFHTLLNFSPACCIQLAEQTLKIKAIMKTIHNLIIVDESGSMECIRQQAANGITETLQTIAEVQREHPETEQRVTLLTFGGQRLTYLYDDTPAAKVDTKHIAYNPNGMTPLYDAIGGGIAKTYAVCGKDETAIVTIITDGEENSSREYKLDTVKQLIEKQRAVGWTVSLIGTDNLDVKGMARSMAIDNHLSFTQDAETTSMAFKAEKKARRRVLQSYISGCAFSAEPYFEAEHLGPGDEMA